MTGGADKPIGTKLCVYICTCLALCMYINICIYVDLCMYGIYVGIGIYICVSPEIKRQGREADDSPPSSAEVKKDGTIHELHHKFSWNAA
jgi:hypothetical protein